MGGTEKGGILYAVLDGKDLDDSEFQILGVKTIGWRKTIRAAAIQYN